MRILWHSNSPTDKTGYGRQTALWARLLQQEGHQVAISAFHGWGSEPGEWEGIPVYPARTDPAGMDVIAGHAKRHRADLVITLQDCWIADPAPLKGLKVAHWVPVDCSPLASGDKDHLTGTGGTPIAMTGHGEKMLREAGFEPLYVPHGIDCSVFTPILPEGRRKLRKLLRGIGQDRFVIGINAANQDKHRKSFSQQFQAFAAFRSKHPEALLLVHARARNAEVGGLLLDDLARACGLEPGRDLFFSDQDSLGMGTIGDEDMANWYRCLDVLSMPSHAEGFGLPLIEAQACGIPVVTTRADPMRELCGAGWLANGDPFWVSEHDAWWTAPSVRSITSCYEQACRGRGRYAERAREFALRYDAKRVLDEYWKPALSRLQP